MEKKRLEEFKSKASIGEIESEIAKKLDIADNDDISGQYLSSYDASQINKNLETMPIEENEDD